MGRAEEGGKGGWWGKGEGEVEEGREGGRRECEERWGGRRRQPQSWSVVGEEEGGGEAEEGRPGCTGPLGWIQAQRLWADMAHRQGGLPSVLSPTPPHRR